LKLVAIKARFPPARLLNADEDHGGADAQEAPFTGFQQYSGEFDAGLAPAAALLSARIRDRATDRAATRALAMAAC